jgi:hypothetical protein
MVLYSFPLMLTIPVPISVGIIFFSLLLGFNEAARATLGIPISVLMFAVNITIAWIITHTGLYTFWRNRSYDSGVLKAKERRYISQMKSNALRGEVWRNQNEKDKRLRKLIEMEIEMDEEFSKLRRQRTVPHGSETV